MDVEEECIGDLHHLLLAFLEELIVDSKLKLMKGIF
jgi:hypothetical protein